MTLPVQGRGVAAEKKFLNGSRSVSRAAVQRFASQQPVRYPIRGLFVHFMTAGVSDLMRNGYAEELVSGRVEYALELLRAFGLGVEQSFFKKCRPLFEGAEGGAARIQAEAEQERVRTRCGSSSRSPSRRC